MNERFKELARQCYETGPLGKDGWPEYTKFNEGKFAKLIVNEALDKIDEVGYKASNNISTEDTELFKSVLKRHFGVEE